MKKVISLFLAIIMLLSVFTVGISAADATDYEQSLPPEGKSKLTADTVFESGETYLVNDYEDFKIFVDLVNAGQTGEGSIFELTSDIVANYGEFSLDENNEPLHGGRAITQYSRLTQHSLTSEFKGVFDGKNNSIIGLYSTSSGLFSVLNSATVQNLCINNSLFDLRGSSSESAGALSLKAEKTVVSNVVFKGIVINDGANTGGIVGEANNISSFDGCRNYGTVIGADYCGGIIGKQTDLNAIRECLNKGKIISSGSYVGGIVSTLGNDTAIEGCANAGEVSAEGNYVGGIVGTLELDLVPMKNCYHSGSVSGNDYVGGLAGSFHTPGENLEGLFEALDAVEEKLENAYDAFLSGGPNYRYDDEIEYEIMGDSFSTDIYRDETYWRRVIEYLENERDLIIDTIRNSNTRNLLYSYSAGDVTASGEYIGSLFGEMTGCVWRCDFVVVNYEKNLFLSGKDYINETVGIALGSASADARAYAQPKIYEGNTVTLQSEDFAEMMSSGSEFIVDANDENNGYVMLKSFASVENEPGAGGENEPGYNDEIPEIPDGYGGLSAETTLESGETYYINNYEDLKTLSYLINEKGESTQGVTFVQTKDIVANSGTFSLDANNAPLYNGSSSLPEAFESIKNFSGIFDGQNYTISGLYLNAGLFENCEGAEIKNIYIENSLVLNENEASSGLGTISSVFKNSTMAGCSVDAIVIGKGNDVGGIVGKMVEKSAVRESRNLGNVFGGRNVGGVAGAMDASYAYDCYNAGDVCGKSYVGGFAGYMDNAGAGSSYNIGDVSGGTVGGFAGCLEKSSPSSCYTAGKVNGASTGAFCGEFIGDFFDMFDISGCYFLGYSQSGFDASGTVGYLYSLYRKYGNSIMYPPGSYYPAVVYTLSVSPMTEAELKSKDMLISNSFVYDAANENEGYPMMKYFHKEHTFSDYSANQDGTVLVAPCSSRKCEETHTIMHTHTWGEYTTDANGNQAAKCLDEMCKFTNVKDKTISRVTVDPIDFTTNEGKIYNFTFEKDGDYKLTISAPEKAALCASVYLNGELVEENTILKWTEGLNLSSYYTEGTVQTAEIELKGISAGDKVVVILHDKTGVDDTISRVSYYLKYYYEKFAPSSVKLTIGKLLPPPEEITVNVGTTDVITFTEDETKLFKFSAEKDGDYKFTVSGADKALVRTKAYKNGELLSEEIVATSSELSSAYDSVMMPASSLELKGLAAGDEIVLEVTESVNWAIDTEPDFKGFEEYFMPSGVTVCVEDITPPPPEEITVNVGTTDVTTFEEDETKLFKFSAEKDGDYKFTVSGADKALVRIKAYKNGELISEDIVMTTDELSSAHEIYMKSFAEFELKGLAAGDEIVFEVTESVNYAVETEPHLKGLEQYFMPSGVTVCVEDITPLFNFGVTPQHIRKSNGMVYYPATFDFSMYEDSDIRYSDICRDNANGANGWPTTFTAKYIYDASILDFIEIYTNSSFAEVKVLEHGSTGETGPDGQEYNYIIVQTTFSSIGFGDGTGMYYLKFAVIEEKFINADGSIRTVVDNVPYNGNPFAWEVTDPNGDIHDWSKRVEFNSFDGGKESYIYNDLLLEDDLIETNVYINTTITPEHARVDNYAYYPVEYKPSGGRTYESWVRTLTGYSDGSTKAKYWVYYDSTTLELVDALPSKELYDLGGTVTVLGKGVLDPVAYPGIKYAVVQVEFEGFSDLEPGYLMSFKFNVLKEDFIEADGSAKNLVQISLEDWSVTNTTGKSIDVTDYVFTDVFELAGLKTYSDLIIDGYVPFDPELFGTDEEVFELVGGATVMAQGGVNYIVGLQPSLTKAKFKSTYVNYGNVDVEISATTSRYLGTGSTVTVKSKSTGEVIAEYVVVIYGDVDGSATINGRDALAVSNSVSGAADVLTGAAKLAANVEGTRTTINAKDAAVLDAVAGGTMIIDQTTGKGIAA